MGMSRGGTALFACLVALTLGGCTVGGAGPSTVAPTPIAPDATATPTEPTEPPPSVEAVIVVASIDVDGAHATVSGYVSGVIEDDGECSFVFTGPSDDFSVTSVGTADRSTTSCGAVSVPIEQFSTGSWTVVLGYRSDEVDVMSEETPLEVP